jgi:hypothetical protein
MERINEGDEDIGEPDEEEIVVLQISASVPRDDEEAKRNDDTDQFGKAMKKEVALEAYHVEGYEEQPPGDALPSDSFAVTHVRPTLGPRALGASLANNTTGGRESPEIGAHRFAEKTSSRARVLKRGRDAGNDTQGLL